MKRVLISLLISFSVCSLAQAETRYVSDQLSINMRTGTSTSHRIIRTLKSGDAVEILERSDTGYTLVKHRKTGAEGWVLERQLMNTPHARTFLKKLEDEVSSLQQQQLQKNDTNKELSARNAELEKQISSLETQNKELKTENDRKRRIYANAEKTQEKYNALIAESKKDKNIINNQLVEIELLKADTQNQGFMMGAGVLFLGLLLGLIIPKIKFQKRSSWDSL